MLNVVHTYVGNKIEVHLEQTGDGVREHFFFFT